MITFILLAVFFLIGVMFAAVAYSANQRKRAGMNGTFSHTSGSNVPKQGRAF